MNQTKTHQGAAEPAIDSQEPAAPRRSAWAEAGLTMRLAVPLMAAQVSVVALGLIDTATFGVLGTAALAGGGLGASVFGFANITSVGVMIATSIQVAYASTAERQALPGIMRAGLLVALVLGTVACLCIGSSGPLLLRLGQDPAVVADASRYFAFAAPALLPNLIFTALRGLTVGLGRPGPVTAITVAAVLVKATFNLTILLALNHAPPADRVATGLMLAGAANTITYTVMALALWIHCVRQFPDFTRLPRLDTWSRPPSARRFGSACRSG